MSRCIHRKKCDNHKEGDCFGDIEECYREEYYDFEAWKNLTTRPQLYDPYCVTKWCEQALSGKCPIEKKLICIKNSHDICLTGKYQESREHWEAMIEKEAEVVRIRTGTTDCNFYSIAHYVFDKRYPARVRLELPPI
jgi:hypothetical protein